RLRKHLSASRVLSPRVPISDWRASLKWRDVTTGKMGLPAGGGLSLFCPGGDLGQPPPAHMGIPPPYQLDSKLDLGQPPPAHMDIPPPYQLDSKLDLGQPPPAHMGIPPPYQLDSKLAAGLARTPMYPFPGGAYPYPMLSPEISQVASWSLEKSNSSANDKPSESANSNNKNDKKPHIKKPLNAFMLYMKEMRAKVVAECTLKESAAINQILGRRWHSLSREEQAKYYEKARQERQLHMQLYPGWSARDNYGYGSKKKKRKKDRSPAELGGSPRAVFLAPVRENAVEVHFSFLSILRRYSGMRSAVRSKPSITSWPAVNASSTCNSIPIGRLGLIRKGARRGSENRRQPMEKCRARYGLDQQNQWCKPCRRKKKCVRYMEALAIASGTVPLPMVTPQSPCSEDDVKLEEMSDASSDGDADTPLNSASSPGGLSALSSLASPASDPPPAPPRNPVGTNPRDANNPLSVGQLTSQTWPRAAQSRPGHEVISVS
ncbi:Uncharacterized protein OBRU01_09360, partial [Operophtera brumata]